MLEHIPSLVLSEILRDVDLFVGMASVGNDPTWADGGSEGRYRDYWTSYAFGDLSEIAKMRREVLSRLIPRLKIAARCALSERFLVALYGLRDAALVRSEEWCPGTESNRGFRPGIGRAPQNCTAMSCL